MAFELDGDAVPTSHTSSRRTWISSAEGIAARIDGPRLWIDGETSLSLRHSLPDSVDLGPLLGKTIRATLVHVVAGDGSIAQTVTICSADGKLQIIAHAGVVKGTAHTLGSLPVYVALSQRPGGPLVFGTARLQSLVRVGDHVRVRDVDDEYVMCFTSRTMACATYVIANSKLWIG
jgi:hypothetical protein